VERNSLPSCFGLDLTTARASIWRSETCAPTLMLCLATLVEPVVLSQLEDRQPTASDSTTIGCRNPQSRDAVGYVHDA
jgi:hypothetical protein